MNTMYGLVYYIARGSYRILSLRGETPKFGVDVEGVL